MENLLGPGLQDLGQNASRHDPWLPSTHAGDLHRVLLVHHGRQGIAATALDFLGGWNRGTEPDGDVVREVVTANRQDAGVPQAAAFENGEIRRSTPDIHQRNA